MSGLARRWLCGGDYVTQTQSSLSGTILPPGGNRPAGTTDPTLLLDARDPRQLHAEQGHLPPGARVLTKLYSNSLMAPRNGTAQDPRQMTGLDTEDLRYDLVRD